MVNKQTKISKNTLNVKFDRKNFAQDDEPSPDKNLYLLMDFCLHFSFPVTMSMLCYNNNINVNLTLLHYHSQILVLLGNESRIEVSSSFLPPKYNQIE